MPPSDQEPRYRLVDSNGNVVGALWSDGNGNVKIADETDTQTTFGPDGISTPALEADSATVDGAIKYPQKTKTISSGSVDVSDSNHIEVDGESESDDDLTTLSGGVDGQRLIIRGGGDGTITVKDGVDNIQLSGSDRVLDTTADVLVVMYDAGSGNWVEISFVG